ncbi:hypothetical protein IPJ72_05760 [Candidatus Peregrinibacteria bacterium]|nr:MAG: hypothetical protein IPJ72_05760 [Candidatus Peregrinibacteria bacterium]
MEFLLQRQLVLDDCRNCSDCFGCSGLRNKQYYIFNKPYTKAEYQSTIAQYLGSANEFEKVKAQVQAFHERIPKRALIMENCENSIGNYLSNCKNAINCFEVSDAEDCRYCYVALDIKNCMDSTRFGYQTENCYEIMGGTKLYQSAFVNVSFEGVNECLYVDSCINVKNCFGCVGLRQKQYCILNKQYSKEDYETLVPKIIEHMKQTGEWGEFFPAQFSPFGYKESVAQEYQPLSEPQIIERV